MVLHRENHFSKSDGFDVYVDSVRFLPASSTLPAMEITLMNTHFEKVKFKDFSKDGQVEEKKSMSWLCDQSMDAYS